MWWDGKHILSGTVIHAEDIRFLADTLPSHVPRQSRDACGRKVYELPKEGLDHVLSNLIMGEDEVDGLDLAEVLSVGQGVRGRKVRQVHRRGGLQCKKQDGKHVL